MFYVQSTSTVISGRCRGKATLNSGSFAAVNSGTVLRGPVTKLDDEKLMPAPVEVNLGRISVQLCGINPAVMFC